MKLTLLAALSILTSSVGEVQIPIENIRSVTYDKTNGTEMYVNTTSGTQTFLLSDIVRMTFDHAQASALPSISAAEARGAYKVLIDGVVYVVRDGQVFTLKGEKAQ